MATLEKRIAALEQADHGDDMEPMFIHFVGMGYEGGQIQRITNGGQEWQRQPDETEQGFKDRALGEVAAPRPGCRILFLCY